MKNDVIKQAVKYVNKMELVILLDLEGKDSKKAKTEAEIECCMLNAIASTCGVSRKETKKLVDKIILEKSKQYA